MWHRHANYCIRGSSCLEPRHALEFRLRDRSARANRLGAYDGRTPRAGKSAGRRREKIIPAAHEQRAIERISASYVELDVVEFLAGFFRQAEDRLNQLRDLCRLEPRRWSILSVCGPRSWRCICRCSRNFSQTINSRTSKKTAPKIAAVIGDMM